MWEYYTIADMNVLGTPEIMGMLLSKLPGWTKDKWSRRVLLIRRKQGKEPKLADFIDFVNDENLIVSDPVFSKEAVEQYIDKKTKSRRVATYVSGSKETFGDLAVRSPCINCGENHQLNGCLKFMDMALKDRITFLLKKSTDLDICNQWRRKIMPRIVIKDWTVEPALVVIQQPCMIMCQKWKRMLKWAMKMMSLSPIALLT